MASLDEALAALAAYVGTDPQKAKEVAKALRDDTGEHAEALRPVAKALMSAGALRKKGETDKQHETLAADLKAAQARVEELEGELETAKAAPTEQQEALVRKLAKAEKERDEARTLAAEVKQARLSDRVELSVNRFLGSLKGRVDEFGLDALQRRYRDRFKPADDGTVQVLDEDGDPIEAPKGRTAEEVLADAAYEGVPAGNRLRSLNPGGGSSGGGNGTGVVTVESLRAEKQQSGTYRL